MSPIIDAWNQGARMWWSWCLHSTWQGLVLLVLVLAVLPLFKRVSPHWRYALLFVALLKFLLPPMGMDGYGLFAWLFPPAPVTVSDPGPLNRFQFQIVSIENYAVETTPVSVPEISIQPLTPAGWGLLVHVAGSVMLVGFLASQVVRLRMRLKRSQRVQEGPLLETVTSVGQALGLRGIPWVYISTESESPCAGGAWQKFVLLPGWVELLSEEECRVLLAHELAHLKRWDTLCNWFQILSQVWLWWNPAVWWLNSRIRAERELCCDDLVLSLGFAAGGDYSRLLVDVASRQRNPELAFEAMGMADSFRRLKERIDRAMDSSLRRRTRLSLVSAAVLVAIAVAVLPGTRLNSQTVPITSQTGTDEKVDTTAKTAEKGESQLAISVTPATAPSIEVDLSLLEFPAHSERDETFWKRLSDARILPLGGDDSHPIVIVSQDPDIAQLDQILANDSGIRKLASPKVRTFSGQKGMIAIGQELPYISCYEVVKDAKGVESASPVIERASSGIFIDLLPKVKENQQIDLNLHLKRSITGEPGLVKNPLTGKEEPVGNPVTVLTDSDVQLDIVDSKTAAINVPLLSGDPAKLVVLVTARVLPTEDSKPALVTKEFQLNKEYGLEYSRFFNLRLFVPADIIEASGDGPFLKYDESTGIMTVRHEPKKLELVQLLVDESKKQRMGDPQRELKARKFMVVGKIPEGFPSQLYRQKQVEFLKNVLRTLLYADKSIEEAAAEGRVMVPEPEKGTIDIVDTALNLAKVEVYLKSVSESDGLQQKPDTESDTVQFLQKPDEIRGRRFVIAQPILPNITSKGNAKTKRDEFKTRVNELKKFLYGSKTLEEAAAEGRVMYPDPEQGTIDIVDTEENLKKVEDYVKSIKVDEYSVNTETPAPRKLALSLRVVQITFPRIEKENERMAMEKICPATVEVREWSPLLIDSAAQPVLASKPWVHDCVTIDQTFNAIAQLADIRIETLPRINFMTGPDGEITVGMVCPSGIVTPSTTESESVELGFRARVDIEDQGGMVLHLEPSVSISNPNGEPIIKKGLVVLPVKPSHNNLLITNLIDPQVGDPFMQGADESDSKSRLLLMVTVDEVPSVKE